MVHSIRGHKIFSLVEERSASDRIVEMKIPIRRMKGYSDYSLRLLELMTLIAAIRIVKAKRIFEFGTFLGNTTLHLALNSPKDAHIWTLDADDETLERIGLLDLYFWRAKFPLEFEGTAVESKVHCVRADSHKLDIEQWLGDIDLILIDGDHSGEGVRIDTDNALSMLGARHGCIAWHDYGNPLCEENTKFLDGLSERMDLFTVEDTHLVLYFSNPVLIQALKAPYVEEKVR